MLAVGGVGVIDGQDDEEAVLGHVFDKGDTPARHGLAAIAGKAESLQPRRLRRNVEPENDGSVGFRLDERDGEVFAASAAGTSCPWLFCSWI